MTNKRKRPTKEARALRAAAKDLMALAATCLPPTAWEQQQQKLAAQRSLAHRLIDIGYIALAKELHPDTPHGDSTSMARLNRVRDKLKHSI
jgi:hypothetical protein